jgi:hypothetical protein
MNKERMGAALGRGLQKAGAMAQRAAANPEGAKAAMRNLPQKAMAGMAKVAGKMAGRGKPAYASGGYAGKTSTEARMCKPTAARAGASFKGGKK